MLGTVANTVTTPTVGTTWTTKANMNTARRALGGAGVSSSALSFGGYIGSYSAVTELFS